MKKVAFAIVSLVALCGCDWGSGAGLNWLYQAMLVVSDVGEFFENIVSIPGAAT